MDANQDIMLTLEDSSRYISRWVFPAEQLGKTGHESATELDADRELFKRMEAIRRKAGELMGMGDVSKMVVPKIGLLAAPRKGGTITSRYFVPYSCHKAHAVTGTVCVASACVIPGTVASRLVKLPPAPQGIIQLEHPSGMIAIDLDAGFAAGKLVIRRAALIRTARRLFQGEVLIPAAVWAHGAGAQRNPSAVASAVAA